MSGVLTQRQIAKVQAAMDIIQKDFSVWHRIEALAKSVRCTEHELQIAFKLVYGKTVMSYARKLRLEYGHHLLEKHDYPLRVICEMVGYPDPSNFSVAFSREFGFRLRWCERMVIKHKAL